MSMHRKDASTTPVKKRIGLKKYLPKKQAKSPAIKKRTNIAHLFSVNQVQRPETSPVLQPVELLKEAM